MHVQSVSWTLERHIMQRTRTLLLINVAVLLSSVAAHSPLLGRPKTAGKAESGTWYALSGRSPRRTMETMETTSGSI